MKLTRIILSAAVAALIAAPAMAEDAARASGKAAARWAVLDTDKDGFISTDEWAAEGRKIFDRKDANHDGKLSREEWRPERRQGMSKGSAAPASGKEGMPAAAAPAAGEGKTAPAGQ